MQQQQKSCQAFLSKLYNSHMYDPIRDLLFAWKEDNKKSSVAIDTFIKIFRILQENQSDEKLLECFNKCLVKDVMSLYINPSLEKVKEMAFENPNSYEILDNVYEWLKKDKKISNQAIIPVQQVSIQSLKDSMIWSRIQEHPKCNQIGKIIHIYLRSIISIQQVKSLLSPIAVKDASLYHAVIQAAQDTKIKKRRFTIFAPLNQLVDQKYPIEQVGGSYVLIPDGYAHFGKNWKNNVLQYTLNRKCISVPLGSEVSFTINKKTQEEEKLFSYEDQRYEIDYNLQSLKAAIRMLKKGDKIDSPLIKRIVNDLYPNENIYNIFVRNMAVAKTILLPRLEQKQVELIEARNSFVKTCEDIANKNFYISLDYRGFYFAKNDKKFNSAQRWEKEIDMRKKQILDGVEKLDESYVIDRQALQHARNTYINSFDNITKEQFIKNKSVDLNFDRKMNEVYPQYPHNQVLFICNFQNEEVMNDALQILLYFCPSRRTLLETLVFKMMKKDIKRRIKKNTYLLGILESRDKIMNIPKIKELLEEEDNLNEFGFLNYERNQRNNRDSEDEFMDMIEEDLQPALIEDVQSPFEGPDGHTFIGTKICYLFLRYLTTIYQRFLKAKQYAEMYKESEVSGGTVDLYEFFLINMIFRSKDKKTFEDYLRKIFCKDSFIFFTLDKIIQSAAKLINTIPPDSLTDRVIKDLTKDYQYNLLQWNNFQFPTVISQLTRLYHETETLFRFTHVDKEHNIYISAWNPIYKNLDDGEREQLEEKIQSFTVQPAKVPEKKNKMLSIMNDNSEQVAYNVDGLLVMKGDIEIVNPKREPELLSALELEAEIKKLKRVKYY